MLLTIGMPTYDDFDGVYFSIQALRMYHDLTDCEILVIDNHPNPSPELENVCNSTKVRYVKAPHLSGTCATSQAVFDYAEGEFVLCMDCHILFEKDSLTRLKKYLRENPQSPDLLQGPLLYDDLQNTATHFDPIWRDHMWGTWGNDSRVNGNEPFDIPMQGLGVFAMRKAALPGFNRLFKGFGGGEGYIHEKVRQRGGRTLCLPWFKWVHRFGRPKGVPYPLVLEDRIFNYIIGHQELGLSLRPVIEHFKDKVSPEVLASVIADVSQYSAKDQIMRGSIAASIATRKLNCVSLGPVIDRASCNCSGKFVHACEKHVKCRPFTKLEDGIISCQECKDYEPEDPVQN